MGGFPFLSVNATPRRMPSWSWGITYGSILGWMNIHLPPLLMFTRGFLGFDPQPLAFLSFLPLKKPPQGARRILGPSFREDLGGSPPVLPSSLAFALSHSLGASRGPAPGTSSWPRCPSPWPRGWPSSTRRGRRLALRVPRVCVPVSRWFNFDPHPNREDQIDQMDH